MPARTGVERRQGLRHGLWKWVVRWIRGVSIDWELEVGGRLEEFEGGIAGRIEIGWISGHGGGGGGGKGVRSSSWRRGCPGRLEGCNKNWRVGCSNKDFGAGHVLG